MVRANGSAAVSVERFFEFSLLGLVTCGYLAVAGSGYLDVPTVVHSLVLPMVMLCLHKHSIGACAQHKPDIDPHRFIRDHIELMLHGMQASPPAAEAPRPAAKAKATAK